MAENKTRQTDASVDAFLAGLEDDKKVADARTLIAMMSEVTGEPPKLWGPSIIGFGSYHYVYDSGREGDMPVVGFSPRKKKLVLYIMPGFGDYEDVLARLGKHKTGKSCLYVNKLADVDESVLRELVQKSVAHMAERHGA